MVTIISHGSGWFYHRIAKPLLFRRPPDAVHHSLVEVGKFVQQIGLARWLMRLSWGYQRPARLRQTIAGLTFQNPVGLAAGFDKNFELMPLMRAVGFGFMEGGSITYEVCRGNPHPWFYRLPKSRSLVVNAGLANQGVVRIVRRLQAYSRTAPAGFPINVSVAKTNSPQAVTDAAAVADYIGSLRHLQAGQLGDMVTLNISCPNTYDRQPFTTPERLEQLLAAVDELELQAPVFIKMPNHLAWPEFQGLAETAARHRVAGVTISNLAYRDQVELADELPESVKGKLSGKPLEARANELIRQTRLAYRDRFVIIGVGGIFSAEDAYAKIRLGANLVELITGMIFEGPQLIGQINAGLVRLLDRDGYATIAEACGADLPQSSQSGRSQPRPL